MELRVSKEEEVFLIGGLKNTVKIYWTEEEWH